MEYNYGKMLKGVLEEHKEKQMGKDGYRKYLIDKLDTHRADYSFYMKCYRILAKRNKTKLADRMLNMARMAKEDYEDTSTYFDYQ